MSLSFQNICEGGYAMVFVSVSRAVAAKLRQQKTKRDTSSR
jgi:hypothetical protein